MLIRSLETQTLWYLQSSLSDLFAKPTSETFTICHRIYNRVQSIIFTDPPIPSSSTSFLSPRAKEKVNVPHASFVGIGILAAAIGMPKLAEVCGPVAVEQGRRIVPLERSAGGDSDDEDDDDESGSGSDDDGAAKTNGTPAPAAQPKTPRANGKSPALSPLGAAAAKAGLTKSKAASRQSPKRTQTGPSYLPGPRLEATPPPAARSHSLDKPSTSAGGYLPTAPLSMPSSTPHTPPRTPRQNGDTTPPLADIPARRRIAGTPGGSASSHPTVSLSVPSLPLSSRSASYLVTSQPNPPSHLPKPFLAHLLLLQSSRTQLDLLRSLQDISTRLVSVPKLARLSSLRAELTVLNHGLPRGCCLGMACHGTPFPVAGKKSKAHARIVRISPSESVVLNSADRAPFVIHVEVLEDDLDFDPDRRQNAEDLRRALSERDGTTSASGGFGKEGVGAKARMSLESGLDGLGRVAKGGDAARSTSKLASPPSGGDLSKTPSPQPPPIEVFPSEDAGDMGASRPREPLAEMDLVEQLYGDVSIHDDADLLIAPVESDVEIQNRSVDEQAWARRVDAEKVDPPPPNGTHAAAAPSTLAPPSSISLGRPSTAPRPGGRSVSDRPVVSLDDYAERMRMAAIMLAQLDASQAASLGVVATGTAAAGTLVGLPVATVAGIGGVVGAGLGAVASRLGARRDVQGGQASTGVSATLDTSSAVEGTSAVAGAPPLPSTASASVAPAPGSNGTALPSQRQRVLAPLEAAAIRNRIMSEMMALEEERMERMREDGRARSGWSGSSGVEDGAVVMRAVNKDDPSGAHPCSFFSV